MFSQAPDLLDMVSRFSATLLRCQTDMEKRLSGVGLTTAQLSVLSHLAKRGRQRVTDISKAVEVGQPAVTKMLNKFEAAGWVKFKPSENDGRSRLAHVTEDGLRHMQDVQKQVAADFAKALEHWSPSDIEGFADYLRRFGGFSDDLSGQTAGVKKNQ